MWGDGEAVRERATVLTGLVTRAELNSRGVSDRAIRRAVADGDLVRVARGVYRSRRSTALSTTTDQAPDTGRSGRSSQAARTPSAQEQAVEQYRATVRAVALRGDDPLVSHSSAAALYRFPLLRTDIDRVHLSVRGPGTRRGQVVRHPVAGEINTRRIDGVRVTDPTRTVVDIARTGYFSAGVVVSDGALRSGLVTPAGLQQELLAAAGRTGIQQARAVLAFCDGRAESAGESLTRIALHALGFSPPELQVKVFDASGRDLGRVDFAYPEYNLLIEFDGLVKYGGLPHGPDARSALIAEKRREDRIRAAGFVMIRLLWRDVMDRQRLRSQIVAALDQAAKATSAGVVTGSLRLTPRV